MHFETMDWCFDGRNYGENDCNSITGHDPISSDGQRVISGTLLHSEGCAIDEGCEEKSCRSIDGHEWKD